MLGLLFWIVILSYMAYCVLRGRKQDVETHNKTVDEYVDHIKTGTSYSIDANAGIYHDWRGMPRDVVTGKIAVEHQDIETGERWVVDKNHRFIRNLSEQEWKMKEIEGLKNGEDLIRIDTNAGSHYKRFNFVEGWIYKDVESGKYCVIKDFFESYDNYYKWKVFNKERYSSKERQWELCRERYRIVVDTANGHFVRFEDKSFVPRSPLPLEQRINEFNSIMDEEWLERISYRNRSVAGRHVGGGSYWNKVYF